MKNDSFKDHKVKKFSCVSRKRVDKIADTAKVYKKKASTSEKRPRRRTVRQETGVRKWTTADKKKAAAKGKTADNITERYMNKKVYMSREMHCFVIIFRESFLCYMVTDLITKELKPKMSYDTNYRRIFMKQRISMIRHLDSWNGTNKL